MSVFETSTRMSVVQLTALLYGDTSRTLEVLRLNDFDEALSIPAHTSIRYYAVGA